MTHMPDAYGQRDVHLYQEPERTSVMAILSLVLGILGCCTFVTAPIGVLLGIFGLIGISRSKGRVGGTGLAIGGLIVSVLSLAIWLGMIFGVGGMMKMFVKQFGGNIEQVLTEVQNGDYDAARAILGTPANNATDAELAGFHAAYTQDLGSFVGLPNGLGELLSGYGAVIEQFEPYNGRQGYIPMPIQFDSDWVLAIYVMNPNGGGGQGSVPTPEKIILVGPDGREYTIPANAGDIDSVNLPDGAAPAPDSDADSQPDEAPGDENADETGTQDPEGP